LEIPNGLSLLATFNPNATVKGLANLEPSADWPNVELVHFSFDGMVGSGFFALFVAFVFWLLYWRSKRKVSTNRLLLLGILLTGPLSFLAIEFGWMVTEIGRQPWVIYGYLRTADAVTTSPWLDYSFFVFTLIYVLLAVTLVWLLLLMARSPLPQVGIPGEIGPQPQKVEV
jgi:cytochrome d ubiquinol oxidase subunit I